MIVVTNRIAVAEGREREFEERFRNRARLIDKEPGFIRNLVLRPVRRRKDPKTGEWTEAPGPGVYLVQTYWKSEEDFWRWTQSESFRKAHADRPPADMFAGPNVLEIHEVVMTTETE